MPHLIKPFYKILDNRLIQMINKLREITEKEQSGNRNYKVGSPHSNNFKNKVKFK